jgi:membrane protein DedA with SNARE-associated domain
MYLEVVEDGLRGHSQLSAVLFYGLPQLVGSKSSTAASLFEAVEITRHQHFHQVVHRISELCPAHHGICITRGLQSSGCGPYTSSVMEKFYPLIEHYGYLIVLFGVMLGTMGIPFPSAAILLAAGVLVQQGHLDLGGAVVCGILGAIIGNQIGYWLGHRAGRPFVLKWGRYVKLTPERLERVEHLFARHGGKAVFAARFFSVSRLLEALVAGISRMRWSTFLVYSALSGMVWATAVVLLGYFFGEGWGSAQGWSGRAPLLIALLLVVALGFYLAHRWTTSRPGR